MKPLHATKPSGLPHDADGVAKVASALGWELMPWQYDTARVLTERLPDGRMRYPVAVVSTPRQAGKSTLLGALMIYRCLTERDYQAFYTAQTRKDARETWGKWVDRLGSSLTLDRWRVMRANGQERAVFEPMGSGLHPFARMEKALHGQQTDLVVLDEVWEMPPDKGEGLLQAVTPTQATRPRRQIILVSTAGNDESVWFRGWVERGRDAVNDPDTRLAHVEYAAAEDVDPCNPETWASFHPGYPAHITHEAMESALDVFGPDQFRRAYGNQWPTAEVSWRGNWSDLATDEGIPADAPVTFAVDSEPTHQTATIVAATLLPDDQVAVEVIDHRRGTDWVLDRVYELATKHHAEVAIATTGPLAFLIPEGTTRGVPWIPLSTGQVFDSVARIKNLTRQGRVNHPNDPRLNEAVDNALTRQVGDREGWRRLDTSVSIAPLVAVSLAAYVVTNPKPAPVVISR